MAGKAYAGVNGIARAAKKMYVGVAGTARLVKRAYIGINGLARLFFSYSRSVHKSGAVTDLSVGRGHLAAAAVGNYAVFAGGFSGDPKGKVENCTAVDAYGASLTRTTPTALSEKRSDTAAATIGGYAIFTGGLNDANDNMMRSASKNVDAYSASLTRYVAELSGKRMDHAAAAAGNHALIAGGQSGGTISADDTGGIRSSTDAYDASLTRTAPTDLSVARYYLAAAPVGNYVLFGGGSTGREITSGGFIEIVANEAATSVVDAYNTSLTRTTPTALSFARERLAAAGNGSYAVFAGGYPSKRIVDAYDISLTRVTPADSLNCCGYGIAATRFKNYALFGGGKNDLNYIGSNPANSVDAYDTALTHYRPDILRGGCGYMAAAQVGNYALFGGGDLVNGADNKSKATVEVYTIS